ncbi:MAG TPA: PD-(D/E)XK nuclease family protein, partial [Bacilli bacterium]|nr:PD-(D/E)XK nuclease family protein [Bacilli bacterium]
TISQRIGNLFHDVLYEVYKNDIKDYDKVINEVVDKYFDKDSNKDKFYIEKYRKALKQLISLLDEQLSKTDYHNEYFEEWFSVEKENDLNIKILGKIDKVLTLKDNDNTYVIVVDYKTGALHGDFNKVVHGFDMQLLYYLYLIKNSNKINNPKFTGMYLQSIMTDVLGSTKNKTYEELIKDNMKLFGYTISSLDRLYEIDHNYNEDSYIKSMRVKKDGSFYSYSKVLSEEVIEELINIVDNNINEAISSINNSSFDINPKKIGNDLVGCEYCPFKDICYMNNNNIVDLKVTKNLEFLGGDE